MEPKQPIGLAEPKIANTTERINVNHNRIDIVVQKIRTMLGVLCTEQRITPETLRLINEMLDKTVVFESEIMRCALDLINEKQQKTTKEK